MEALLQGDHIVCPGGAERKSPDWQWSDTSGSEKSILNEKVLGPISNEMPTKRPRRWEKQIARSWRETVSAAWGPVMNLIRW